MSAVTRLIPASRRSYSSFFSSKPGGGRFFNSSKPPKPSVITAANRSSKAPAAPTKPGTPETSSNPQDGGVATKDGSIMRSATGDNVSDSVDLKSSSPSSSGNPSPSLSKDTADPTKTSEQLVDSPTNPSHIFSGSTTTTAWFSPTHPVVKSKEFKLHQFFSLYRPLLLLSNPSSIFQLASPATPLFSSPEPQSSRAIFTSDTTGLPEPPANLLTTIDNTALENAYQDYTETSTEADAEAARQLTRSLTMSRAGATIQWEETLRRLGLDVEMELERIVLREQMEKEWEEVLMDSTKRKRRKKMKKHKLKKRRKETRSTRLKIGR
ncbi:hypothetical protein AMATHDRAFT_423 [Amanita thiersii Skay4041]|uniref:Ribosomal protein mS38 C-terminal domain-containing protein n=1 Tax=Amanita thiersii Skay4041 TaxID=703135 RepID=A0A2A9P0Z1_9AGAR|nr:hypothetical protein AMATHDRAFT_423 [Amanita thiersii Skay4041]